MPPLIVKPAVQGLEPLAFQLPNEVAIAQLSPAVAELGQVLSEDEVNQLLPPLRRLRAWLYQNRADGPAATSRPTGGGCGKSVRKSRR